MLGEQIEGPPARLVVGIALAQLSHGGFDRRDDVVHLDQVLDVALAQDQRHETGE